MMKFRPTGQLFSNRKEAKRYFGHSNYNRYIRLRLFDFNVIK